MHGNAKLYAPSDLQVCPPLCSFGTSVGSGALTIKKAIIAAAFCEFSGAVTLGQGVSDTIIKKISKLNDGSCWNCGGSDEDQMRIFMLGELSKLVNTNTAVL